jgi:hypothetical protein
MNTDREQPDLHQACNTHFLLKEETHAIIGCAFVVLNFKHPRLEWERVVL